MAEQLSYPASVDDHIVSVADAGLDAAIGADILPRLRVLVDTSRPARIPGADAGDTEARYYWGGRRVLAEGALATNTGATAAVALRLWLGRERTPAKGFAATTGLNGVTGANTLTRNDGGNFGIMADGADGWRAGALCLIDGAGSQPPVVLQVAAVAGTGLAITFAGTRLANVDGLFDGTARLIELAPLGDWIGVPAGTSVALFDHLAGVLDASPNTGLSLGPLGLLLVETAIARPAALAAGEALSLTVRSERL